MRFHLILPLLLFLVSCSDEEKGPCTSGDGLPSINHVWTCTEGSEGNSNGYYLDYPDGKVTTSTNTINYMPGDNGWFNGLTITFFAGEDPAIQSGDGFMSCDITYHYFSGVFEKVYNYGGVYDTVNANYYVPIDEEGEAKDWANTEQPNILITEGDSYYYLEVINITKNDYTGTGASLELFKSQMDTFTNWWDPLNDTVYWSSYDQTRKYTR
tara:strand:- start:67 stop:702 length:636 start_codon:yes stop_codon:yes gene_type:complete